MLLRDKVNKKSINQNIENQNQINFLKKGPNYNNLKFIMPKILNKSSNSKKYIICENIEDTKISKNNDKYFVSQPIMLKEIRNIENLNHINNFIMILKQHISIENELTEFIYKSQEVQSIKNKAKLIINLYNTFFNQLDYITFDINIFINKEYNLLLQKIIKLLMYYHCYIFLYVVLNDSQTSFTIIRSYYFEILKIISFCLYNLFTKFIYKELSNNKYKDLSFISSLNSLLNNNKEYIIKSTLSNNDIYSLINQNYNLGINKFIKAMNDKGNEYLEEVEISLKKLLLNLNQKDLLYHIDICLNIFLYSILEKNIEIAKKNSKKNIVSFKNKSLNLVPYLPPFSSENINKYKYTIVLDIDETLGHFIYNDIKAKYFHNYGYLILDNNNKFLFKSDNKDKIKAGLFLIRPYAKFFLEKINNLFFEIVMFSAGTKEYCDKVLDILDINNNLIKYRLYRTHLSLRNINNDVKDLSLLGRDLSKVIMIDNYSENYKLQQDNGLPIDSWTGDIYDTSLRDLIPIMNYIVENNVEDVREVIKKVKTQLNNISSNSFNYEKINLKF
jgi:Dullard-like phosphatase family protein